MTICSACCALNSRYGGGAAAVLALDSGRWSRLTTLPMMMRVGERSCACVREWGEQWRAWWRRSGKGS
eukprot:6188251-Pleurochrysis_carterae.AAC.1